MFSMSRRRAVVLLALSSILLITLDLQGNAVVDGVRRAFGTVFQPLQDAGRVITRPIGNAWRGITQYDDLEAENERLQDRIDQQEGAFIAALATARDAQELLALNGIDDLTDISSITAQVVGESPTNFSQTVEINQGSSDGLRVGMPVVNAAGLVGKVTEVFANRSIVMLATDVSYAIPIQVLNLPEPEPVVTTTTTTVPTTTTTTTTTTTPTSTSTTTTTPLSPLSPSPSTSIAPVVTSIAPVLTVAPPTTQPTPSSVVDINALPAAETGAFRGRGSDRAPIVEFVDQSSRFVKIKVGAVVITAGGSKSLAPRGIVIGRVVKIVERSGTSGAVLEVRLTARLSTLNFVRVLLYQPAVSP
ncbi:MAG: rod shape-determining protein MreC [Actinobacteria bacterium]|nr:rod shape-determining protein MreC [Actinomycetota bacterium]